MSSGSSDMVTIEPPPAKPPLPEDRRTIPLLRGQGQTSSTMSASAEALLQSPPLKDKKTEKKQKHSPKKKKDTKSAKYEKRPVSDGTHNRDSVKNGIYDLDKLLYSLESTIRLSQGNLSDKESLGYASPTSKVAEVSFGEDQHQQDRPNPELAYAINTIKAGDVMGTVVTQPITNGQNQIAPHGDVSQARDFGQYDNCAGNETEEVDLHKSAGVVSGDSISSQGPNGTDIDKPPKPKIAPKPPSVKIPKPLGAQTSASGEALHTVSPPYAKVDSGKRVKK